MKVGSLFAGIGGIDLGLERVGMRTAWQIENDPYCTRVLAKHWPDVPRWGDIREVNPDDLPQVDLIAAGFPCQPVSVAGRGLAQADERWLWPEAARLVRALRPRWVLLENVPGLLARGMGDVLGELAASGYDAEWDCVPASAVGAPHRRDRVWIVAHASGGQLRQQPGRRRREGWSRAPIARDDGAAGTLADASRSRYGTQPGVIRGDAVRRDGQAHGDQLGRRGADVADAHGPRLGEQRWPSPTRAQLAAAECGGWWATEPDVGRVAHGVPARVDRLKALGNAVVPQVVEHIGRLILAAEQERAA